MPFDHNARYHPLLLRHVPPHAESALDVGCGTGALTRKLAATGLRVEGVDTHLPSVAAARALAPDVEYRHENAVDLKSGAYDFVTCVAALHHMPLETLGVLRGLLAPGGTLAVLGLARPVTATERVLWTALAPLPNLVLRGAVALGERVNGGTDPVGRAPVRMEWPSSREVRAAADGLLPGHRMRPLLFWRYLLTWTAPA